MTLHTDADLHKALLQAKSFVTCAEEYFALQSCPEKPSKQWELAGKKNKCIKIASALVQRLYKFKNNWSLT